VVLLDGPQRVEGNSDEDRRGIANGSIGPSNIKGATLRGHRGYRDRERKDQVVPSPESSLGGRKGWVGGWVGGRGGGGGEEERRRECAHFRCAVMSFWRSSDARKRFTGAPSTRLESASSPSYDDFRFLGDRHSVTIG